MFRKKRWSDKQLAANTEWRLNALAQIKLWMDENNQGSYDKVVHKILIKRFDRLETFIHAFSPEAPPAPFDFYDAAALIVLPVHQAVDLARKLFGKNTGILKNLRAEDLPFNMNWFRPRGFQ